MKKDEAETLVTTHPGIIYGTNINANDGYLYYWLGSANYVNKVCTVVGYVQGMGISTMNSMYFDNVGYFGVRPVVEISKSDI